MIDIHCHIIPDVDDGPKSITESREILKEIKNQGIRQVIQTTHINDINRDVDKKKISEKIKELENDMDIIEGYEVNLSHVQDNLKKFTIAGTRYILVEFSPLTTFSIIIKMIERVKDFNLIPIVAHIERYTRNIKDIKLLKSLNILLQVNAETFINDRFFQKIIFNDLIDFIASDMHPERKYLMKKAYEKLKKFNGFLADRIFSVNPKIILRKEDLRS